MIVDSYRERLFCNVLTNHILIQCAPDFHRFGHANIRGLTAGVFVEFLVEDALANVDATVADINSRARYELAHFGMALATERAHGEVRRASHIGFGIKTLLSRLAR